MEIASVISSRLTSPARPGHSGGLRPGRNSFSDPVEATELTETMVRRLEAIGAAVESMRPGEAFFAVDGLRSIHGGGSDGVLAAAREAIEGRHGGGWDGAVRIGTAPNRFAAFAAAWKGVRVPRHRLHVFLAPLSIAILRLRLEAPGDEVEDLVVTLERLGIETLQGLSRISAERVADRFGPLGLEARRLAHGEDTPLRPRQPREELAVRLELPEGIAGQQLDRAVELLVDRLLAAPQRRGRTLLGLRFGAVLSAGGSWSVEQGLGRPTASAQTLRSLLTLRLEALPGPVAALRLRALGLGPAAADQIELAVGGTEPRRRRLGAAVREVRAAQGGEALLKILPVDSASRVPERWAMLTPFPEL
jgi:protein ImuB